MEIRWIHGTAPIPGQLRGSATVCQHLTSMKVISNHRTIAFWEDYYQLHTKVKMFEFDVFNTTERSYRAYVWSYKTARSKSQ